MAELPEVPTPFGDPVVGTPLADAPLVAVLAQVRFPPITSIAREEFIGPFQELVRREFPVLRQEREMSVVLTPDGVKASSDSSPVWRFLDRAEDPEWKLSLASSFVALDTSEYVSRKDFVDRLRSVLDALAATIGPASCDRVGVRFVDRVELGEGGTELSGLVRPEVLGVTAVEPGGGAELVHSLSDAEYRLSDATLRARWGRIPPDERLDPLHGEAVDSPSWILDLDMYSTGLSDFDASRLAAMVEMFAERAYRFFRWAVLPDLLRRYGGAV